MAAVGFGLFLVSASLLYITTPGMSFLKIKGETPAVSAGLATQCSDH